MVEGITETKGLEEKQQSKEATFLTSPTKQHILCESQKTQEKAERIFEK